MQGLPANLLTQNVAQATGKTDVNSSVGVNGKVAAVPGEKSAETKGAFASLFANLLGNGEASAQTAAGATQNQIPVLEGQIQAVAGDKAQTLMKGQTQAAAGANIDELLKTKDQEKNIKTEAQVLSPEKVLSAEVLKNVNNLIDRSPMPQQEQAVVGEKVAKTTSGLDQLLKTLKGEESSENVKGEGEEKVEVKSKVGSPLDFLIKESKANTVGSAETKKSIPGEAASKLGLSSEDFLSHLTNSKEVAQAPKEMNANILEKLQGQEDFDPKMMVQKQMNQSMKAYGQKQNLLSDNIIRSPKDLMNKEPKLKSSIDELKSPDLKIGAELSQIKDPFIAPMQKQDQQQNLNTNGNEKVLDLSKMNSSNPTEIIKKISDYIQQSQVANKDQLDLTVKHDSLGQFKIQVNKPVGNNVSHMDMQITTTTAEGHDFFMKHEVSLLKNLSQAGIQLSDLRIVSEGASSSFAGNDSRGQNNNSQYNSQSGREFMSFDSGDSSNGSQRRKELWQEAQNQQRYGA